jgi:alpha-beta hydrolase superfamily lysophospholipase
VIREETFVSAGDVQIFMRSWRPEGRLRAVVVICHGVNSHSGQYAWAAEQLQSAGFAVYALDLRGRGRSGGRRFYIDDVSEYTADLGQLVRIAKERDPGLKIFLLGHSAGGVISCTYALDHQLELAGLICESFAFQVPAPALVLGLVRLLSRVVPGLPVLKLKNEDFSRDPTTVSALNADPLTQGEIQPAGTVAALLRATDRLRREFPLMTLPVFILHGTADKATMPAGSQVFHDTVGSRDKTLRLYEGHFHDLLNDVGRVGVMGDIVSWIDARLGEPGGR